MPVVPNTQFLLLVNWNDHLHPDTRRKAKPPFRWVKLQTENQDVLGDLTLREYGAYCRLLNLAALTNNRTVFESGWIKRRTGITQKDIEKLENRGLIRITDETHDSEKGQENQQNDCSSASEFPAESPNSAVLEGRGSDRNRLDMSRGEGTSLPAPESGNSVSPTPPRDTHKKNGVDRRSFDELKSQIRPVAQRLNTNDPDQIHLLAGQSLRMSQKQINIAVQQLIEDGDL